MELDIIVDNIRKMTNNQVRLSLDMLKEWMQGSFDQLWVRNHMTLAILLGPPIPEMERSHYWMQHKPKSTNHAQVSRSGAGTIPHLPAQHRRPVSQHN
jgi:hypothetical protein